MSAGLVKIPTRKVIDEVCYSHIHTDWIDITSPNNNEINLLVGDFGTAVIAFKVKVTGSNNYSIDWGDTTSTNVAVGDGTTTYQHNYTIDDSIYGKYCSNGYYTYKIRIHNADGNIETFKIVKSDILTLNQYPPLLRACFGTVNLTSLENTFYTSGVYCVDLVDVQLPNLLDSVTSLYQFCANSGLITITLPTSMTSLTSMASAFINCLSLKYLVLPDDLPALTAFEGLCNGCSSLNSVILPSTFNSVTSIRAMFTGCNALEFVEFPTNLNNLTNSSQIFYQCYSLATVILPDSMTTTALNPIDLSNMFNTCYNLRSITLPPSGLEYISSASYLFHDCSSLIEINNLDILGISTTGNIDATSMFDGCTNLLTDISIPYKLTSFGANAASKVTSIRLTNTNSPFSAAVGNHIDVSNTNLNFTALETLYSDLPSLSAMGGSVRNIRSLGATGYSLNVNYYQKGSISYTSGNATFSTSDTSGLAEGMEVTSTSITTTIITSSGFTITAATNKVSKNSHGLPNGKQISFTSVGGATGISTYTAYYVRNKSDNDFELSLSADGDIIDITGDGASAAILYVPIIIPGGIVANTSVTIDVAPSGNASGQTIRFSTLKRSIAILKGWWVV